MSESSNEFWNKNEKPEVRPVDLIVNASNKERNPITPETAVDFVLGCQTIYFGLRQVNPDAVIVPLRGAKPIDWSLEEFEQFYGQNYPRLYLRIGDHINVETGDQHGFTKPRQNEESLKRKMVREDLAAYKKLRLNEARLAGQEDPPPPTLKKPLLIDEVMSGSTLTEASDYLIKELQADFQTEKMYIIAAQDTRGRERRAKTATYLNLVSNDTGDFHVTTVNLPLFHIDRSELLDYLLEPSIKDEETRNKMMHMMHNVDSRDFFKFITRGVLYPKKLRTALSHFRAHDNYQGEDKTVKFFYSWLDSVTNDPEDYEKKASSTAIYDWVSQFAQAATQAAPISHSSVSRK